MTLLIQHIANQFKTIFVTFTGKAFIKLIPTVLELPIDYVPIQSNFNYVQRIDDEVFGFT